MASDPIDRIISIESGGNPNAANPRSSARGAGQFIDSTWLEIIARNRPDLMDGRSRQDILELRSNPDLSREMTAAYARGNADRLTGANFEPTPANTYLAHFAGPGGAIKVLGAAPDTPVQNILGAPAIRANPFLAGMTARDLQAWASRKMGAPPPQGQPAMLAQAPAPSPGPPINILPQIATGAPQAPPKPAYAWTPQNAPAPNSGGMASMQPLSLAAPPRRPPPAVDITQILALLSPRSAVPSRFSRT